MKTCNLFDATKPCSNCPYRTDAPVKHWHRDEFKKVIESEQAVIGAVFNCHKDNGSVCVGWLIKQVENDLPSIGLRLSLSRHQVTREYLDSLASPAPLYKDIRAMIRANFPGLLKTMKINVK